MATIVAVIAAPFTCMASTPLAAIGLTLAKIALTTLIGTATALAISGTIAGIQSALTGHGFWQAFTEYAEENFVEELIISFAFASVATAASSLIKCFQCFKEGTLVETEDGLKPIEEIEVGDMVLAYDEETGERAYKPVLQLFRNETKEWYHIFANGEEIVCTGGHPFYVAELDKFIPARELKVGSKLLLSSGKCVTIEKLEVETLEQAETTYNFEVADFHTYYVSESNVLVHNTCERAAMRAAKRSENIPLSQKPDHVVNVKMVGENGRVYYAKAELYGNKFIRNDFGGHLFNDGGKLAKHFNAGTWSGTLNDIHFYGNGIHFWYT